MGKSLLIAEKPSVAQEFAKTLGVNPAQNRRNGYLESEEYIVTWCVGHLITKSYPEVYDASLKRWSLDTLPFIPKEYKYEVIASVKQQYEIVKALLNRSDVSTIYVCTDSGREGEYIYRLVEQMAKVHGKERKRVWIDSQTEEEIRRGIREAKDLSEYDNLSSAAYLRAKEDYLIGINFSRLLTLKFGPAVAAYTGEKRVVLSIGRVMTCVLGMVVNREREIRNFVKTPFYRVIGKITPQIETLHDENYSENKEMSFEGEWRAVEGSYFFEHPKLYKENGFKEQSDARFLIDTFCVPHGGREQVNEQHPLEGTLIKLEKKLEKKNAPLLFNLAELQNECSRRFKLTPDETLKVIQELYEKKLVTYPRTDARVLSTAAAKEIHQNIRGLCQFPPVAEFAQKIYNEKRYSGLAKTRYVNDKQITDHYAIVPTGQGFANLSKLSGAVAGQIYEMICRRFLSIFYPPAQYQKYGLEIALTSYPILADASSQGTDLSKEGVSQEKKQESMEHFFANFKVLTEQGYLEIYGMYASTRGNGNSAGQDMDIKNQPEFIGYLNTLKKGQKISFGGFEIRDGETSPPSRYNSGSIILAMENAGQLIEDEELRAQMKGSGIGTSATRAEILKKLITIKYLRLNTKTQVITPSVLGELVYDVADVSMKQLLNPEFTASWEKGLTMVAQGEITEEAYMEKLESFVRRRTAFVKGISNPEGIRVKFNENAEYFRKK